MAICCIFRHARPSTHGRKIWFDSYVLGMNLTFRIAEAKIEHQSTSVHIVTL